MPSVLDQPLTLLPSDQPVWPPPGTTEGQQQQDTRPVTPGDVIVAQSLNPPAQPAAPNSGGDVLPGGMGTRSLAATSATFKPLSAADPKNKDDVNLIDTYNQYLASGKSIDDLSPDVIAQVNRASGVTDQQRDNVINNNPELFYQLKFKTGKYEPPLLDEIGNPTKWPEMLYGFAKAPLDMVVSGVKGLWDTATQDVKRGDLVVPYGPTLGIPLSKEGAAQRLAMLSTGMTQSALNYINTAFGITDVTADALIQAQKAITSDPAQREKLDRQQSEIIRQSLLRQNASAQVVDNAKTTAADQLRALGMGDFANAVQNAQVTPEQAGLASVLTDPATYLSFGAGKAAAEAGGTAFVKAGVGGFHRLEQARNLVADLDKQMADNAVTHQAFQAVVASDAATPTEKAAAQRALAGKSATDGATAINSAKAQAEFQAAQAAVNKELSDMAKPSMARAAVGTALQGIGGAMQLPAIATDWLDALPRRIIDQVAPNLDDTLKEAFARRLQQGISLGGLLHGGAAGAFAALGGGPAARSIGRDLAMAGQQLLLGQQTLPFWKAVAENTQGMSRFLASRLDNQLVYAIPDTVRGAAHGAAIGGAQGFLASSGTTQGTVQGAGTGGFFGTVGAGLGQLKKFNSPAELHIAAIGDRSRFIPTLSPDSSNLYLKLRPEEQLAVAAYARAHPDLQVNFFDDPSQSAFNGHHQVVNTVDGPKGLVNINVSGDNPIQQILQHEIGHHIAANGLSGQVDKYMLGDPVSGEPGLFAKRNPDGTPMTQIDRYNRLEFVPDETFEAYKAKYNSRLPKGTPPEDNHGIAQEMFAELHASALSDPRDVQKMTRGYLPDALVGDNALKNWFARVGVPMDATTGTPAVTDTVARTRGLNDLVTDFYNRRNFKLDKPDEERGVPRVPLAEFRKGTPEFDRLAHQLDATGDLKRNPDGSLAVDMAGRPQLVPEKQVDAQHSKMTDAAIKVLQALPPAGGAANPNTLALRTDRQGRQFYTGQSVPQEVFRALTASNEYNPNQLLNWQRLNGVMERNDGTLVTMVYNTAGKGGKYATLPARTRAMVPIYTEISPGARQTNIKSFDPEQLTENITKMLRRKAAAEIWDGKIDAATTDVKTYLDNLANGRAGETGLGLQKKGVINQLFGFNVDANPTVQQLELKNPSVIKSFRVDRINRLQELPGMSQPFHWATYEQVRGFMQPKGMAATPEEQAAALGRETVPVTTFTTSTGKVKPVQYDYGITSAPLVADKQPPKNLSANDFGHVDFLTKPDQQKLTHLNKASAVTDYADKLVTEYGKYKNEDWAVEAKNWYNHVRKQLKIAFGGDQELFAHLLAATSPQQGVVQNFKDAFEAYKQYRSGAYDAAIREYKRTGKITADMQPTKANGALFGANSDAVLKVLAGTWLDEVKGPKTANFFENLFQRGTKATIDKWAARTMRRLGYEGVEGAPEQWRLQPKSEKGVSNLDFAFSQEAFKQAADRIGGMKPHELQAILWYAEKHHWASRGYSKGGAAAAKASYIPMLTEYAQHVAAHGGAKAEGYLGRLQQYTPVTRTQ